MTDNEIMKALECCGEFHNKRDCSKCPYCNIKIACSIQLAKDALDLINRQRAEIEALQMDKKQLEIDIIIANNNYEHIKSIWESDHQKLSQVITKWKDKYKRLVIQEEDIKSEAVREFAERLKEYLDEFYHTDEEALLDTADVINNLVKETAGEG